MNCLNCNKRIPKWTVWIKTTEENVRTVRWREPNFFCTSDCAIDFASAAAKDGYRLEGTVK